MQVHCSDASPKTLSSAAYQRLIHWYESYLIQKDEIPRALRHRVSLGYRLFLLKSLNTSHIRHQLFRQFWNCRSTIQSKGCMSRLIRSYGQRPLTLHLIVKDSINWLKRHVVLKNQPIPPRIAIPQQCQPTVVTNEGLIWLFYGLNGIWTA